ncbi:SHOCT domain-containing protein [Halonotius terrestris]|uniref:SHOCT domain-containing protein n=2 Tax=Halonotius terrestris TaxID=2487750 RepID=A0A8J8TC42_9EURY|nr:SHOCT domain-containing protein [Halonotius terrestris]
MTTTLILLVAFGLLALDVAWFWVAFPVGFAGVLPAVMGLVRYYERSAATDEPAATDERDDPVEALKDRYARGEIDDAEFERRLEELLGSASPATVEEARSTTAERESARERTSKN